MLMFKIAIFFFMLGFVLAVFLIALLGWLNDIKEEKENLRKNIDITKGK